MQRRDLVTCIILSILTCGIYGIYWFIVITDDVKRAANDQQLASGGTAFIFTILTCGIYSYYWAYKMGELTKNAQMQRNMPVKDNAVLYLILQIFGLGIVTYCLVQNDLNEMIANDTKTTQGVA